MHRRLVSACALIAALTLIGVACSSKAKTPVASSSSPAASLSESAMAIPTATTITMPVTYGFYDGHIDTMLSTDVANKAQASALHINYSAAMLTQKADKFPSLFRFSGRMAAGQQQVFTTEPGESDYTPFWEEVTVTWKRGVTPTLLTKDDAVNEMASKGRLTLMHTGIVLNCPIVKVGASSSVPSSKTITLPVTYGYYDGHVDTMLSTDVSNKAQASAIHANFSSTMVTLAPSKLPSLYRVTGAAAPNQPQVFGSEPGEDDYSPLWQEVTVTWKPGVTPVLLTKDDQVKDLAGKGMLTVTPTPIVLNCPIVHVG
jgi:hypothetical protein